MVCALSEGIIDRTGAQTMLYLMCTMIASVDLTYYGVSCTKDWVSVDYGTRSKSLEIWTNSSKLCVKFYATCGRR